MEKKIPQPSPTEKQKLNVVSHSALLSSSPGTPAGPPKQPSFLSPRERSRRAELCTSSQAESNMQNGLCYAEGRKKERMQPNFLPIPSRPSFRGRNFIPKQVNQHRAEGACPPPLSFLGEPHPQLGSELH